MTQEEEWAKLMKEPDPLAETDIYATVKEENTEGRPSENINLEEQEMEDQIGDVLKKSFNHERSQSSLVQNIPVII